MYLFCLRIRECQEEIYKQDLLRILIMISFVASIVSGIVFSTFSFFIYHFAIVTTLTLFVHLTH